MAAGSANDAGDANDASAASIALATTCVSGVGASRASSTGTCRFGRFAVFGATDSVAAAFTVDEIGTTAAADEVFTVDDVGTTAATDEVGTPAAADLVFTGDEAGTAEELGTAPAAAATGSGGKRTRPAEPGTDAARRPGAFVRDTGAWIRAGRGNRARRRMPFATSTAYIVSSSWSQRSRFARH